jgi:hypothetical protein
LNKSAEEISGSPQGSVDAVMKHIKDFDNITDFGLRYLLEIKKDLVLS